MHTHTHTQKTLVCMQSHLTLLRHVFLCHCVFKTNCHLVCLEGLSLLIPNPSGLITVPISLSLFLHISRSFCFSHVSFHHPVIHLHTTTVEDREELALSLNLLLLNFPPLKEKICQLKRVSKPRNMGPVSVSIFLMIKVETGTRVI